jgi:phosphatidylcholine synthase
MTPQIRAALVHVLTASGAALALLALLAATAREWSLMFAWLGLALVIDGIDGPLARRLRVAEVLPRWSGDRLDLMVDYLTYIAVPAFALTQADLLPEVWRLPAAIAILLSSLFHMSDVKCKTEEGFFVGFPAIWNIVLLYLFAITPAPLFSLAVVVIFVVLTLCRSSACIPSEWFRCVP